MSFIVSPFSFEGGSINPCALAGPMALSFTINLSLIFPRISDIRNLRALNLSYGSIFLRNILISKSRLFKISIIGRWGSIK